MGSNIGWFFDDLKFIISDFEQIDKIIDQEVQNSRRAHHYFEKPKSSFISD
jgi:hypothetical protein